MEVGTIGEEGRSTTRRVIGAVIGMVIAVVVIALVVVVEIAVVRAGLDREGPPRAAFAAAFVELAGEMIAIRDAGVLERRSATFAAAAAAEGRPHLPPSLTR